MRWRTSMAHSGHRVWIEELPGDSSHVDIPAFVLSSVWSRCVCDGGKTVLHIFVNHRGLETPAEGKNRDSGVLNRTVSVSVEGRDRFPQLAPAIVLIRCSYQRRFRVDV